MGWYGMESFPTTGDEKVGPRPRVKTRSVDKLLDALADCLKTKHVADRLGGYEQTVFDRRKARKIINEWL